LAEFKFNVLHPGVFFFFETPLFLPDLHDFVLEGESLVDSEFGFFEDGSNSLHELELVFLAVLEYEFDYKRVSRRKGGSLRTNESALNSTQNKK